MKLTLENLLYGGLLICVLLWRLVGLGEVPLSQAEAQEALAAWRHLESIPAGAESVYPLNPLGRMANLFSFSLLGNSDFAARLPTALLSALLVLLPLLYRRWLGRHVALALALGLGLSPVAMMAGRTLSGMVWALALLLILAWAREKSAENESWRVLVWLCVGGIIFLTTPLGILLILCLLGGLALSGGSLPKLGGEAALAVLLGVVIVSTVFFTIPSGLSAVGAVLEAFWAGIFTPVHPTLGRGYVLLVSWRYEWFLWLFALLWLFAYAREATRLERFLLGWWGSAVLLALLYAGASADFALALTLPLLGLCISLFFRLLHSTSYGFWEVPAWAIPLHGLAVAGLLASFSVSLLSQSEALYEEARLVDYAKVFQVGGTTEHVRIGTLRLDAGGSSMALSLPLIRLKNCQANPSETHTARDTLNRYCEEDPLRTITIQVIPLDEGAKAAEFVVRHAESEPKERQVLGDGLLFTYTAEKDGEQRLDLLKSDGQVLTQNAQYLVIVLQDDVLDDSFIEGFSSGKAWTGIPQFYAAVTVALRALRGWAFVLMLMLLLLLPMTFFLVGAFYGGRTAWRGIALGFLIFGVLHGFGIAWQGVTTYAGDARELWYAESFTADYHTLAETLREYSKRSTGTVNEIQVTVQGESDGALAWALRRFKNARFVTQLDASISTPAIVAPDLQPRPVLGAEYVGQALIFDLEWKYSWLNWTDLGEWWFKRQTRFEPLALNPYRVWIEKTLYDVENIPEN